MNRTSGALLRPLAETDLEIVRAWRNSPRVASVMFTDEIISEASQRAWFAGLKNDPTSVYLVFEVDGIPTGLVSFKKIDPASGSAVWGFYRGREDAPGTGLAMGFHALQFAFETRRWRRLTGETFSFNKGGIAFHEKLGFRREGVLRQHALKNGRFEDVIVFGLLREEWMDRRDSLKQVLETGSRP